MPNHEALLQLLKMRFEANMHRHEGLEWNDIQIRLANNPEKLNTLSEMELTGGEPDVVKYDASTDVFIFFDCSVESPKGRRSLCYDRVALEARKKHKPKNNALDLAMEMDVEILTEDEYRHLQKIGDFDLKTSSWIQTPTDIRNIGGALFCDYRYGHVFVYHNGADSYYAARGFRSSLRV